MNSFKNNKKRLVTIIIKFFRVVTVVLVMFSQTALSQSGDADGDGIPQRNDDCPTDASNRCVPTNGTKNILLIVADDLGVDNVSVYDEQSAFTAQTPTIDALADEGVLFRNTWANPQCSPARASILTGRHAFRHGVTHPAIQTVTLAANEETFAEILVAAGYQTALFGKWHLGTSAGVRPTDQGFQYYSGSLEEQVDDYFAWEKTVITSQGGSANVVTEREYATKVTADEAIEWINDTTGPWLAQVSFNAPHVPFHVPPAGDYSSLRLAGDVGDACTASARNDDREDCYRAAVESMDSHISEILDRISPSKLADTLIIFMGDNGTPTTAVIEAAGSPFAANHAKSTMYEGGVNVPLIISGGTDMGVNSGEEDDLIQIQDVFSTILDLANVSSSTGINIDGQSLIGYVDTETARPASRSELYSELYSDAQGIDRWAVTNGTVKYINNEGGEECYNLLTDSGETDPSSGATGVCNRLRNNSPGNH